MLPQGTRTGARRRAHRPARPSLPSVFLLASCLFALALVLAMLATPTHAAGSSPRHKRIKLDSIRTLTFYAGERTTARRTSAVPQLSCRGKACRDYQPDVVQCTSMGDGQWKCEADLPHEMRFGKVEVSCEGWDHPDDPYVLSGSCGLTYNLVSDSRFRSSSTKGPGIDWGALLFWVVFLGILYIIASGWLASLRQATARPGGASGRPGWGGGGGGGGWWPGGGGGGGGGGGPGTQQPPPPPPYSKDAPGTSTDPNAASSSSGWRPGFWSGLAAGVIGDRLFNNNNGGGRARRQYYDEYGFGTGQGGGGFFMRNHVGGDDDGYAGGRGFGGGRAGGFRGGNTPTRRSGGGGGGSGSGSGSGSMRRSTGFGGTNNR